MKSLVLFSTIVIAILAASHHADIKEEFLKNGFSDTAAEGLANIGDDYDDQLDHSNSDNRKAVFKASIAKAKDYIKTQSEADQTAYRTFIEKKKAEFPNHADEFE